MATTRSFFSKFWRLIQRWRNQETAEEALSRIGNNLDKTLGIFTTLAFSLNVHAVDFDAVNEQLSTEINNLEKNVSAKKTMRKQIEQRAALAREVATKVEEFFQV